MVDSFVVAKVLPVNSKGDVLVLRRSKTDTRRPLELDLAGGWVDEGEDFIEAAIRETQEEAGIRLSKQDLRLVYTHTATRDNENTSWLFFIAKTDQTEVKLSPEHDQAKWVSLDQAIETNDYKIQRDFLVYVRDNDLL